MPRYSNYNIKNIFKTKKRAVAFNLSTTAQHPHLNGGPILLGRHCNNPIVSFSSGY